MCDLRRLWIGSVRKAAQTPEVRAHEQQNFYEMFLNAHGIGRQLW